MKYFATIQDARQNLNLGTSELPKFGQVKSGWVFECNSKEEIKESLFTPGELIEFNSQKDAMDYLKSNCDNRFIEFAPYDLVLNFTPSK